jgi:amino-acid N-acetyltransferase
MIRQARVDDVPEIARLINGFADSNLMLHRPVNQIYERLKDYVVVEEEDGEVAGCAALHVLWFDLAEICSVAVNSNHHGRGFGRLLVERLLADARAIRVHRVFMLALPDHAMAATARKLGFREESKQAFPQKVWSDCLNCPKFTACDEIALIIEVGPKLHSPHEWESVMSAYGDIAKLTAALPKSSITREAGTANNT